MKTEVHFIIVFSFYIFLPLVQVSNYFYHHKTKQKIINSNKTSAEAPRKQKTMENDKNSSSFKEYSQDMRH